MVQALLERVLSPEKLDAWFERTAVAQYTRELLFSTVFELMNLVVFKTFPSVHAAYQNRGEQIGDRSELLYTAPRRRTAWKAADILSRALKTGEQNLAMGPVGRPFWCKRLQDVRFLS
jgi:hypothetical protein